MRQRSYYSHTSGLFLLVLAFAVVVVLVTQAYAAGEEIYTHVFSGGGGASAGAASKLSGTTGQPTPTANGQASSAGAKMNFGFWYPIAHYDTEAPDTTLTGTPAAETNLSTASFTFTSTEDQSTFECRLVGEVDWETCTSPKQYTVSDGSHTFEVKALDKVGNPDPSPEAYTWEVDATAPTTSADIATGIYNTDKTVTLTCSDAAGHCGTIWYSTDGTNYSAYSVPLSITATTTLWFYSEDAFSNQETPANQRTYTIDKVSPVVAVTQPANLATVTQVLQFRGNVTDTAPSSGISSVQVQVYQIEGGENWYLQADRSTWDTTPQWITATGTSTWSVNTSAQFVAKWYYLNARVTDVAGNVGTTTSSFYFQTGAAVATSLSLTLSSSSIENNATVDLSGQLTRLPYEGQDLSGLTIRFTVTGPVSFTASTATYDQYGHYTLLGLSGFTQEGTYQITAYFDGNTALSASASSAKSLNVGSKAGYAIIVVGSHPSDSAGIPSHHKTGRRVYDSFMERGFAADDIYFFSYQADAGVVDDSTPTKAEIQDSIVTWAKNKMNGSAAPLYIVLVDHGSPDTFYIGNETISPTELNTWLSSMEGQLTGNAPLKKRVIIAGACYSGTFLQTLAGTNRIIISSAAGNEVSYRGPLDKDGIRSGEFFVEELFKELVKGYSLKESFVTATERTEAYTLKGGSSGNAPNSYGDYSVQHPMLEDNSQPPYGTNSIVNGSGDGIIADTVTLGIGVTNAAINPADFTTLTDTLLLGPSDTTATLHGTVSDNNEVDSAWVEIRFMANALSSQGGTGQVSLDAVKVTMTYNSGSSRWETIATPNLFTNSGIYEVYYFTQRKTTLEISTMRHSRVYKDADGNHQPGAFDLLLPLDGTEKETVLVLDWQDSADPDGDTVTYTVLVSEWPDFRAISYKQEEINQSALVVGVDAGLQDGRTYYWKVIAIDQYGAARESTSSWHFTTHNINGLPARIQGKVTDSATGLPVAGATITFSTAGSITVIPDGTYSWVVPPGAVDITVTATGYQPYSVNGLPVAPGETVTKNISLTPASSVMLGDVNSDTKVNIVDALLIARKSAGLSVSSFNTAAADVNCDNKINIVDALLVARKTAGLAVAGWCP